MFVILANPLVSLLRLTSFVLFSTYLSFDIALESDIPHGKRLSDLKESWVATGLQKRRLNIVVFMCQSKRLHKESKTSQLEEIQSTEVMRRSTMMEALVV